MLAEKATDRSECVCVCEYSAWKKLKNVQQTVDSGDPSLRGRLKAGFDFSVRHTFCAISEFFTFSIYYFCNKIKQYRLKNKFLVPSRATLKLPT